MSSAFGTAVATPNGVPGFGRGYHLYGALELKRCYQKNLTIGVFCAALVHVLAATGVLVYRHIVETTTPVEPVVTVITGGQVPFFL
jgi:hypothetical protein